MTKTLKVAARKSLLSRMQIKEVYELINQVHPLEFEEVLLDSLGDLDLVTPLTSLEKSDFFTQTIDELVLSEKVDFAIHSAKDLPEFLPKGLEVIALTKGIDPRDALVSIHYTLKTLPSGACIGACSKRRIEGIKSLRPDVTVKSIRGPITERIGLLEQGEYDAIILAEAGLIRIGSQVPREILDIPVAPLQGRLAIVAKEGREDLKPLFACLDERVCGL